MNFTHKPTGAPEDLLRPLDEESEARLGIRLSGIPGWWVAMLDAVNHRFAARRQLVQEAETWPVDDGWLARVRYELGTLQVRDERGLIDRVHTDQQLRRWFLAQSAETRMHEVFCFDLAVLTALAPGAPSEATVRTILDRWSLARGDDLGVPLNDVVLANPVVGRPFIASGIDQWHLFCTWVPHHNPFELIEAVLARDDDLFDEYVRRRSDFLEERTAAVFSRALTGATVELSVLSVDPQDQKEYENDVLVLLDSFAIVAEAKAGRLGSDARRGKGRPLRDRIEELLVRPSQQAMRLSDALASGTGPFRFTRKAEGSTFDVDLGEIWQALTVGVTLDPIADHLPRLAELAQARLTNEAVDALAYSISLSDLELVADVLTHPSDMLHWLGRRGEIDRATWLTGDEMDLLGLYLDTGFNLGENEFKPDINLNVTGMSEPIDEWQYRRQAGMDADQPTVKRIEWWEECLTRVEQRRRPGWSEIGVAMCHVPPPEQRKLLAAMHAFRDDVVAGRRSSKEFLVFHNGPEQRRTLIVGLIATSPESAEREEQFKMAARVALQETRAASVVLMSWTPFPSPSPYLGIGFARSG